MKRVVLALAIIVCCGCQSQSTTSESAVPAATSATGSGPTFVNKAWARTDSTGLPGVVRIFLADGTLVMDSCWETYRLVPWRMESDSAIVWQEDGVDIHAAVLRSTADELVLRLDLKTESHEEHFRVAPNPYLCPDMPR